MWFCRSAPVFLSRTVRIHTSPLLRVSPLAALRKKTGYSLSLCKQALEVSGQDLTKAQEWLKEQALKQGWAKAHKLEGRNTAQGLVGLLIQPRVAAMVELNCETDFVARGSNFHELLNEIVAANAKAVSPPASEFVDMTEFSKSSMSGLKDSRGRSLADLIALNIGQIGENIVLRRGVGVSTSSLEDVHLCGVTHPSASIHSKQVQYGSYGVIMAYAKEKEGPNGLPEGQTTASMARQICQHIIGLNPQRIGDLDKFVPPTPVSSDEVDDVEAIDDDDNDARVAEMDQKKESNQHEELIHQDFLLNSDLKVGQILLDTGIRVKAFARFQLGQDLGDED